MSPCRRRCGHPSKDRVCGRWKVPWTSLRIALARRRLADRPGHGDLHDGLLPQPFGSRSPAESGRHGGGAHGHPGHRHRDAHHLPPDRRRRARIAARQGDAGDGRHAPARSGADLWLVLDHGVGAAVLVAARDARQKLARLANLPPNEVEMAEGRIRRAGAGEGVAIAEAMRQASVNEIVGSGAFDPKDHGKGFAMCTFGAMFVEVAVDPGLGLLRLRCAVGSYSAGRIVNPRTAKAQMTGGIVWGMAAMEQSQHEPVLGASCPRICPASPSRSTPIFQATSPSTSSRRWTNLPARSGLRASANWGRPAWPRRWPMRCSTQQASASASCRSRPTSWLRHDGDPSRNGRWHAGRRIKTWPPNPMLKSPERFSG